MAQKPSIPKGTRDFSPADLARRTYITNSIRSEFTKFGFQPIETPSFENYDTLMGKYGEEGDRLIFKILNSGDFAAKTNDDDWNAKNVAKLTPQISEKALRYDLTVPFARYVVQHQNDITFPFKRYQMQPVWRADRPQKGRFREFYQCDADVVGSNSLWQEVEFVQLYDAVFTKLNLQGVTIKINNRKILSGFAEVIGESDKLIDFTVALDKLDKIGKDGVIKEMISKGISEEAIEKINPIFEMKGSFSEKIALLETILAASPEGKKGIEELQFIENALAEMPLQTAVLDLDVTLARGLNYYTGAIFEVAAPAGVSMGSIGGGGRYDDLTGIFGLSGVSGVGISFGLDRIGLVMDELQLFPQTIDETLDVLCINFGEKEALQSFKLVQKLRQNNAKAEVYPETAKMKKQMNYADKRNIPFVVIIGENELQNGTFVLKNMKNGEQQTLDEEAVVQTVMKG
ncbi:MAG: histidine--tRNA ligase [Capnocytophaga sp.]|nr:histidine--tRNA ligase [Capnocytophaga sp.]